MDKIKVDMENVGKIELQPKFEGKQMIMVVQPI
jgi:translation initiation factor IF-3